MSGYLYLIIGPMFAGKSSKIIRLIRSFKSKNVQTLVIKHSIDTRYSIDTICSHDKITEPCVTSDNLIKYIDREEYKKSEIIVIEEAQFFAEDLIEFCTRAVDVDNKYLIVTGLSGDHKRKPFGYILDLIPLANKIDYLEAYCDLCDDNVAAPFTLKLLGTDNIIEVGESNLYKPVCRKHYLESINSRLESI